MLYTRNIATQKCKQTVCLHKKLNFAFAKIERINAVLNLIRPCDANDMHKFPLRTLICKSRIYYTNKIKF